MSVDDADPDHRLRREAQMRGGGGGERANRLAQRPDILSDPPPIQQVAEADGTEKLGVPTVFVADIGPLADGGAEGADVVAGALEGQEVCEIEKLARVCPCFRQVRLEPAELRDLHLRRQLAADIAQHIIAAGVDGFGFCERPVVHPHKHVSSIISALGHGQRLVCFVQYDKRARRVKAKTDDLFRLNAAVRNHLPHHFAGGVPDVFR